MFACCQQQPMVADSVVEGEPTSTKKVASFLPRRQENDQGGTGAPVSDFDRQVTAYTHGVRTASDGKVLPQRTLEKLREGNERFIAGSSGSTNFNASHRQALAEYGQNPMAAIIGCADSRCPIEILFDVQAGDVFVLRNAGNTLTHAEGSMVGSVEYCVGPLGAKLILVLGHTKCGAMMGATQCMLEVQKSSDNKASDSTLQKLLAGLTPVTKMAQMELGANASAADIAAHAIKVNVFHSIERLLLYSEPVRNLVEAGEVEVHAAVYDIVSGKVDFLGQHPRLPLLLGTQAGLAPKVMTIKEPSAGVGA